MEIYSFFVGIDRGRPSGREDMLLNRCFFDIQAAEEKIQWAIENYNTLRPHGTGSIFR